MSSCELSKSKMSDCPAGQVDNTWLKNSNLQGCRLDSMLLSAKRVAPSTGWDATVLPTGTGVTGTLDEAPVDVSPTDTCVSGMLGGAPAGVSSTDTCVSDGAGMPDEARAAEVEP